MKIVKPKDAYLYAYSEGIKFPKDWYITQNFKWNEVFKNEELSDGIPIYEVFENALILAEYLQEIRDKIEKPIIIHCWIRQARHNKRVGGSTLSAHLNGLAVDFHVKDLSIEQTKAFILAMKLPIRIEKNTTTWVHIDKSSYISYFKSGYFGV